MKTKVEKNQELEIAQWEKMISEGNQKILSFKKKIEEYREKKKARFDAAHYDDSIRFYQEQIKAYKKNIKYFKESIEFCNFLIEQDRKGLVLRWVPEEKVA